MKKTLISILILIGVLQLTAIENYAQPCPPGYLSHSFVFDYDVDCQLRVNFCYVCQVAGPVPANIKLKSITFLSPEPNCPDYFDNDILISKILQEYINLCSIPPCDEPPPSEVVVEIPMCYKWFNFAEYNIYLNKWIKWRALFGCYPDDPLVHSYCQRVYTYCVDYNLVPPSLMFTQIGELSYNGGQCQEEIIFNTEEDLRQYSPFWDIPEWDYVTFETPCFTIPNCDPQSVY